MGPEVIAAWRASATARTRQEHIDAAHALLSLMAEPKAWVSVPAGIPLAGVHAQLAALLPEED